MKSLLYLSIDFFTILIPLIFSFHPKLRFSKKFRYFFPANLTTLLLFCAWDSLFTSYGVWGFNREYLTGFYILNLPIEEILFFICIPFACVFTYHCLGLYSKLKWDPQTLNTTVALCSAVLIITGIYFLDKIYTSVTFLSLGLLLLYLGFILRASWLGDLLKVYAILLLPFFIVNGILTGTGPDQPVVWYNNQEITGLRLLTIPFEDIFYGFELVLLNVAFYHWFESRGLASVSKIR